MPPVSVVSPKLAVKVLKKYIAYFANGLPRWSSEVWQMIQKDPDLEGKWTIGSVRTNITKNRNNILTDALTECDIPVYPIRSNQSKSDNIDIGVDTEHEDESYDSQDDDYVDECENKKSNLDFDKYDINERNQFTVEITRDEWNKIKNPKSLLYKGRKYIGFRPNVWSKKVSYAFWKQHHLKCDFVFTRGRITENGRNYATMRGHCKAKNCKNTVKGIIKDCPGDVGSVYIKMYCRDTRFIKHDNVKRPLNGTEFSDVPEEILKIVAFAWRKRKAMNAIETRETPTILIVL